MTAKIFIKVAASRGLDGVTKKTATNYVCAHPKDDYSEDDIKELYHETITCYDHNRGARFRPFVCRFCGSATGHSTKQHTLFDSNE